MNTLLKNHLDNPSDAHHIRMSLSPLDAKELWAIRNPKNEKRDTTPRQDKWARQFDDPMFGYDPEYPKGEWELGYIQSLNQWRLMNGHGRCAGLMRRNGTPIDVCLTFVVLPDEKSFNKYVSRIDATGDKNIRTPFQQLIMNDVVTKYDDTKFQRIVANCLTQLSVDYNANKNESGTYQTERESLYAMYSNEFDILYRMYQQTPRGMDVLVKKLLSPKKDDSVPNSKSHKTTWLWAMMVKLLKADRHAVEPFLQAIFDFDSTKGWVPELNSALESAAIQSKMKYLRTQGALIRPAYLTEGNSNNWALHNRVVYKIFEQAFRHYLDGKYNNGKSVQIQLLVKFYDSDYDFSPIL